MNMRDFMRKARKEKNMSLQKLGDLVGASHCFLSQVELGRRNPSPKLAKKIAKELNVEWVKFFEESAA